MIGNYKRSGGNRKYDRLYDSLCETMNRRIVNSPLYNLPTYPDEPVYVPDMLVAIVALSDYSKQHNGKYSNTVNKWLERAKTEWIDEDTGPIILNFSPSGTAFTIGSATFFDDNRFRNKLLKTAEIAGHTVKWNNSRHYLLADLALVGEAITLAMRTNCNTND